MWNYIYLRFIVEKSTDRFMSITWKCSLELMKLHNIVTLLKLYNQAVLSATFKVSTNTLTMYTGWCMIDAWLRLFFLITLFSTEWYHADFLCMLYLMIFIFQHFTTINIYFMLLLSLVKFYLPRQCHYCKLLIDWLIIAARSASIISAIFRIRCIETIQKW